jgi:hypothetical protein
VNLIQDHELILPNYTYEHSKVFVILFYKEGFQIDIQKSNRFSKEIAFRLEILGMN